MSSFPVTERYILYKPRLKLLSFQEQDAFNLKYNSFNLNVT